MLITDSQKFAFRAGYLILLIFALIRPLSLMAHDVGIGGFNVLEFVGVGISFLLLIPFFLCLRKFQANLVDFLILLFCLYAGASLFWGGEIRKLIQTTVPFLLYFSTRMFITTTRQLNSLLFALVIGFLIPIAVSTVFVILGRSIEMIEWHNQLPRHAGAFSGSHTLAYTMLFFLFFYCLAQRTPQLKIPHVRFGILSFLLLAIYCLYQSHTRTALFGFVIFLFVYLWGNNKRFFFASIVLAIFAGFIFHSNIERLILKKQGEFDINRVTSGRVSLLEDNIELFSDSSLPRKLIGWGLGHEQRFPFHNDYLSLLISLGIIGLFLYLFLLFKLLWDIFFCRDMKTKYLFGAILISVAAMNFGSNAVIARIELSQNFWLMMGLFYYMRDDAKITKAGSNNFLQPIANGKLG